MKLHEYQSLELFDQYGIITPKRKLASSPREAEFEAESLGGGPYVLKAQVHSGGRGKAGGVKFAHTPQEAGEIASELIGMKLVTKQTGPEGKIVRKLLVTSAADIVKEFYVGFVVDAISARVVMIASSAGGMEIEDTAENAPEKILRESIDPLLGLKAFQARNVAQKLGIDGGLCDGFVSTVCSLYRLFVEEDCSLVEINPLALTGDGHFVAIDAKVDLDQNALARHKDLLQYRDIEEEDLREVRASRFDLNYVSLNGNIGCMVNGAGLAMATMDIIRQFGGYPANFLDVGGSATAEKVAGAFQILLSDKNVKGIFINIFGGIMRCDIIAEGIVKAAGSTKIEIPIVARLEGSYVNEGKEILKKSGLNILSADSMAQGAEKIVSIAQDRGGVNH